jgi:hypothetical protein
MARQKNRAAVALGRLGGKAAAAVGAQRKGGRARARNLSMDKLEGIGRAGAAARWAKAHEVEIGKPVCFLGYMPNGDLVAISDGVLEDFRPRPNKRTSVHAGSVQVMWISSSGERMKVTHVGVKPQRGPLFDEIRSTFEFTRWPKLSALEYIQAARASSAR